MPFDISWMVGRVFTDVAFLAPESWAFRLGDRAGFRADCAWRYIVDGHIALGSEDHGQLFGLSSPVDAETRLRAAIVGRRISGAEVRDDTRDIVITLEFGARIEIVPISSGYESWELTAPDGSTTVAQGGGNLVTWG